MKKVTYKVLCKVYNNDEFIKDYPIFMSFPKEISLFESPETADVPTVEYSVKSYFLNDRPEIDYYGITSITKI